MDPIFSIHPVFFPFLILHRDLESADQRREKKQTRKKKQSNNNQEGRKTKKRKPASLGTRLVLFSSLLPSLPSLPLYFHTFSILLLLARSIPRLPLSPSPSLTPLSPLSLPLSLSLHSYSHSPSLPHFRSRPWSFTVRLFESLSLLSLSSILVPIVPLLCIQLPHYFYSCHHTSPTTSLVLLQSPSYEKHGHHFQPLAPPLSISTSLSFVLAHFLALVAPFSLLVQLTLESVRAG